MMSMMVATVAQTPLVGYRLVVVAMVATGFISFRRVGAPHVQRRNARNFDRLLFRRQHGGQRACGHPVFAWIATLAAGKIRWSTPALFVVGSILIFTVGGSAA